MTDDPTDPTSEAATESESEAAAALAAPFQAYVNSIFLYIDQSDVPSMSRYLGVDALVQQRLDRRHLGVVGVEIRRRGGPVRRGSGAHELDRDDLGDVMAKRVLDAHLETEHRCFEAAVAELDDHDAAAQLAEGREHHMNVFVNRPRELGVRFMKRWGDWSSDNRKQGKERPGFIPAFCFSGGNASPLAIIGVSEVLNASNLTWHLCLTSY